MPTVQAQPVPVALEPPVLAPPAPPDALPPPDPPPAGTHTGQLSPPHCPIPMMAFAHADAAPPDADALPHCESHSAWNCEGHLLSMQLMHASDACAQKLPATPASPSGPRPPVW